MRKLRLSFAMVVCVGLALPGRNQAADRSPDWPKPPIVIPLNRPPQQPGTGELEAYREALEGKREELEDKRKDGAISTERYKEGLRKYRDGIEVYEKGIDTYKDIVE